MSNEQEPETKSKETVGLWQKVRRKIMGKQDLKPEEAQSLKGLKWTTDKAGDLQKVKEYVTGKARSATNWYYAAKWWKKWSAWFYRGGIILLTATAGILPLLNEIDQSRQTDKQLKDIWRQQAQASLRAANPTNAPPVIFPRTPPVARRLFDPAWSAVLLAIAGTLLALDRFQGATTGWVRYVVTAQQLNEALDDFELAFEAQKAGWSSDQPTTEQALAALQVAQAFMRQANGIVRQETKTWAEEFGGVIKELDEKVRVIAAAQQKGKIQVTVTNGDKSPNGWKLTIGNVLARDCTGKEVAVEVPPATYQVRVTGELNGKPAKDEKPVTVAAGQTERVELTLA